MTQETFEQMVERIAEEADAMADAKIQMPGEYHPDWHNVRDLTFATRLREELAKGQEPVVIEAPNYHDEAMGCGLEDRRITDRYEAMRYGFDCAVERMLEQIPDEPLYTRPFVTAPARVPDGWKIVPTSATGETLTSIREAIELAKRISADEAILAYDAMLSAAPADAVAKDAEQVAKDIATNWLPHLKRKEAESSQEKTIHNYTVDQCIKHVLAYAAMNGK